MTTTRPVDARSCRRRGLALFSGITGVRTAAAPGGPYREPPPPRPPPLEVPPQFGDRTARYTLPVEPLTPNASGPPVIFSLARAVCSVRLLQE